MDETPHYNPVPAPQKFPTVALAIGIGAGVLIFVALAFSSHLFGTPQPTLSSSPGSSLTDTPYEYQSPTPTPSAIPHSGEVQFLTHTSYRKLPLFSSDDVLSQTYQKIGTFTGGQYAGADLVLATVTYEGPGGPTLYRFAVQGSKATLLAQHSWAFFSNEVNPPAFAVDATYGIAELSYPSTIQSPDGKSTFTRDVYVDSGWDDYISKRPLRKVFTLAGYGDVYTETIANDGPSGILFNGDGFYLQAPDGSIRVYGLDIPFVPVPSQADYTSTVGLPSLTWADGSVNKQQYTWVDLGGCGFRDYASVIHPGEIADADLVYGGTTQGGDQILVFKDANNPFLKNIYNKQYLGEYQGDAQGYVKVPYATFAASRPVFFWRDSFGRLIRFLSAAYMPQAECGKPVIYLYPPTTTDVSVKVQPQGGMTVSDPAYGQGWLVTAQPDGQILDHGTGNTYPYLFWEGRGGIYGRPDKGWVVPQIGVKALIDEKLGAFGLNTREIADFEEFWLPKMQSAPYYFVTFMGNRVMDALAPLTINPQPDTVIRVLMDYQPLQAPKTVQSFAIHTPERRGFTVVEWGGVLGR